MCSSLQRCLSFLQSRAVQKMDLWSLCHNIFIQGAGWIKYWFVTPFSLPCFFCLLAFSFWWIVTDPKGKYILVAQFPSVYWCWYFPIYFHSPWLLSSVSFVLGLLLCQLGIIKTEKEQHTYILWCLSLACMLYSLLFSSPCLFDPCHLLVHEDAHFFNKHVSQATPK